MKAIQLASALALFLTVVIVSGQDFGPSKKVDPDLQEPSTTALKTRGGSSSKPASVPRIHESPTSSSDKKGALTRALARMPPYFIENSGQCYPIRSSYTQRKDTLHHLRP